MSEKITNGWGAWQNVKKENEILKKQISQQTPNSIVEEEFLNNMIQNLKEEINEYISEGEKEKTKFQDKIKKYHEKYTAFDKENNEKISNLMKKIEIYKDLISNNVKYNKPKEKPKEEKQVEEKLVDKKQVEENPSVSSFFQLKEVKQKAEDCRKKPNVSNVSSFFQLKEVKQKAEDCGKKPNVFSDEKFELFVGNLPDNYKEVDLYKLFSPFGEITRCVVLMENHTISKHCGFVNFTTKEAAKTALKILNGTTPDLCIYPIKIEYSHSFKKN